MRHRLPSAGVGHGHQQATEQAEVADEQAALLLPVLLVVLGPERMTGERIRNDRRGEREGRETRQPAQCKQRTRTDLRAGNGTRHRLRVTHPECARVPCASVSVTERIGPGRDKCDTHERSGNSS